MTPTTQTATATASPATINYLVTCGWTRDEAPRFHAFACAVEDALGLNPECDWDAATAYEEYEGDAAAAIEAMRQLAA